jgi:hypothetical protein
MAPPDRPAAADAPPAQPWQPPDDLLEAVAELLAVAQPAERGTAE